MQEAEIVILHRGAANDRLVIPGKDVGSIGQMFFETEGSSIPFHRVLEIWYYGEKIFDKKMVKQKRRTRKGLIDDWP